MQKCWLSRVPRESLPKVQRSSWRYNSHAKVRGNDRTSWKSMLYVSGRPLAVVYSDCFGMVDDVYR